MERDDFVNHFSKRLNSTLQNQGYCSSRSKAGIQVRELSNVAGVSYQMARKYTLGLALPEYHVIAKIAAWLKVSPSWLLYGETELRMPQQKSASSIEIEIDLLKYILTKCTDLFSATNDSKIIDYIVGIIYDASHIDADDKTILKIIDMMLSSAITFSKISSKMA